jgi:hypothetical protein
VTEHLRDLDWYGEQLGAAAYTGVTFTDVDLADCTSTGAVFEGCTSPTSTCGAVLLARRHGAEVDTSG